MNKTKVLGKTKGAFYFSERLVNAIRACPHQQSGNCVTQQGDSFAGEMKIQFNIRCLILVTFVVAAFCIFLAPFNPNLVFQTTIAGGEHLPIAVIQVENLGSSSVWYRGKNREITSYFSASGTNEKKTTGFMTQVNIDRFIELKPGQSALARFPICDECDKIYFEIVVQDWRGRKATRSTGQIEEVLIGFRTQKVQVTGIGSK